MRVLVVGGGKVGYYLIKTIMEHGHEPSLIEQDWATCTRIANELDIAVLCGDGTIIDDLRRGGAENADAIVCVTGQDEYNLIGCQLAKNEFKIRRTIARANNPKNALIMQNLGVDFIISSTDRIAKLLESELGTSSIKFVATVNEGDANIYRIEIQEGNKLHDRLLSEIRFSEELIITNIIRDGSLVIPRGNTKILSGDKLFVVTRESMYNKLYKIFNLPHE